MYQVDVQTYLGEYLHVLRQLAKNMCVWNATKTGVSSTAGPRPWHSLPNDIKHKEASKLNMFKNTLNFIHLLKLS